MKIHIHWYRLSVVPGLCLQGDVSEERCNSQKLHLSSACAAIQATLEVRTPRRAAISFQAEAKQGHVTCFGQWKLYMSCFRKKALKVRAPVAASPFLLSGSTGQRLL